MNTNHAFQLFTIGDSTTTSRQERSVCTVASFPGEFDAGFAVTFGGAAVGLTLGISKLK